MIEKTILLEDELQIKYAAFFKTFLSRILKMPSGNPNILKY
jgi:hypothetical protein